MSKRKSAIALLCSVSFGVLASGDAPSVGGGMPAGGYIAVPISELKKADIDRFSSKCEGCLEINLGENGYSINNLESLSGYRSKGEDEMDADDDDGNIIPIYVSPLPPDLCKEAPSLCQ